MSFAWAYYAGHTGIRRRSPWITMPVALAYYAGGLGTLCRSPWLTMPAISDQTRQSISVIEISASMLDLKMLNSAAVATTRALAQKRLNGGSHWTIDIATAVLGEPCAYDHGATRMQTAHTLFPKSTCHTGNVVRAYRRAPKVQLGVQHRPQKQQ